MIQPISIAINGTYIQKKATGLGIFTQELLSELMQLEGQLKFYLYSCDQNLVHQYPQNSQKVSEKLSPDLGTRGHLTRLLWYQTFFARELSKKQFSLVYSTVAEGILFPKIPQIVTLHDIIPVKYPDLHPKQKFYYYYNLPLLLKNSQAIICNSHYTKTDIIKYFKLENKNIYVTYPGFKKNHFYPQDTEKFKQKYKLKKYLLAVGDMRPYKNLERELQAFAQLPLKDYQFVIVGRKDPRYYPQLQNHVNSLGITDRVVFTDYVPAEELPYWYAGAAALVFCSLYEGFGIPILEAIACGCPVIASQVTSLPEVAGDAAYYVDPYNVDNIAQGMYQVLTDSHLRSRLIQIGFERTKLFSWEKMAQETLQVFETELSRTQSGLTKD